MISSDVHSDVQENDTSSTIEFIQYHRPALETGEYTITVSQKLVLQGGQPLDTTFSVQKHFSVYGERFALQPQDIQAVFPPDGSLGEHSNVLPHIAFRRSTLPWERQGDANQQGTPWLALLLFDDQEKPASEIVQLSNLVNPDWQTNAESGRFPALQLQTGQKADDKVTVIDIPKQLLQTVLPSLEALALLTHVRVRRNADGSQSEQAVILGNRLPARGGLSTVHLVSLEQRFVDGSFDYQGAGEQDLIRLVSLHSWSFACVDEKQSFKGLLTNLNRDPSTLRLPSNNNADAEKYLAQGNVLLPHTFRTGGKSVSWYHGPLSPTPDTTELQLPVQAADELIRYNPAYGLFDVSYAAAWELGRLLALQSKQFSTNLYLWKRTHAQQQQQAEQQLLHAHLPIQPQPIDPGELFATISAWFTQLSLLQGVPFNYLVPDARLLPKEAIRFCQIDHLWLSCLLDGAFSIGRVSSTMLARDRALMQSSNSPLTSPSGSISGILLRSDVVAGWPGLQVAARDSSGNDLTELRADRLSPDVMLCLFDGAINSVAIQQKPETLHCGLDQDGTIPPSYYKILRDNQGIEQETLKLSSIPWQQEARRTINIASLAQSIQQLTSTTPFTAAQFALQMIEGVEEVIFHKT